MSSTGAEAEADPRVAVLVADGFVSPADAEDIVGRHQPTLEHVRQVRAECAELVRRGRVTRTAGWIARAIAGGWSLPFAEAEARRRRAAERQAAREAERIAQREATRAAEAAAWGGGTLGTPDVLGSLRASRRGAGDEAGPGGGIERGGIERGGIERGGIEWAGIDQAVLDEACERVLAGAVGFRREHLERHRERARDHPGWRRELGPVLAAMGVGGGAGSGAAVAVVVGAAGMEISR